jgi:membrane protein required for colicin V production
MQGYDLFMIIILAAAVIWGAWKGLAWQVASLASVVLSYIAALSFRQPLAGLLSQQVELVPPLDTGLAMLILFLGTSLVVWVGFNLVSESIQKLKLKEFDRQVGALLGLAKGVLLCTVITLLAVTIVSDQQRQQIYNSRSGYYISVLLNKVQPILPPEVQSRLQPYEENLEKNVVPRPGEFTNQFLDGQFLDGQEEPAGWTTEADERRSVRRSSYEQGTANPPTLDLEFRDGSFDSERGNFDSNR